MKLIDLAGSERVSMSEVKGSSLVEAQNINLSLTLLGDVLNSLSKYHRASARSSSAGGAEGAGSAFGAPPAGGGRGAVGEKPFVPYRNSKLTYLLKDSLGGNCKTLMVCAVRAAPACFQQTMMSLRSPSLGSVGRLSMMFSPGGRVAENETKTSLKDGRLLNYVVGVCLPSLDLVVMLIQQQSTLRVTMSLGVRINKWGEISVYRLSGFVRRWGAYSSAANFTCCRSMFSFACPCLCAS